MQADKFSGRNSIDVIPYEYEKTLKELKDLGYIVTNVEVFAWGYRIIYRERRSMQQGLL